ncbi:hypothetical protein HDU76_007373, partial [Blyttiomyces sp. JEL0837]
MTTNDVHHSHPPAQHQDGSGIGSTSTTTSASENAIGTAVNGTSTTERAAISSTAATVSSSSSSHPEHESSSSSTIKKGAQQQNTEADGSIMDVDERPPGDDGPGGDDQQVPTSENTASASKTSAATAITSPTPASASQSSSSKQHLPANPNHPYLLNPPNPAITGTLETLPYLRDHATSTKHLAQQTQEIVIPSYSAWFNLSRIHDIERKALPEFFNGKNRSKSMMVYKEYRDFMVNTYRLNPSEYLTVTATRRNLSGDVCAIVRVHAFLEQWGLINYQVVDLDTRPTWIGPAIKGTYRLRAHAPTVPIHPFHAAAEKQQALEASTTSTATAIPTTAITATVNKSLVQEITPSEASTTELTTSTGKEIEVVVKQEPESHQPVIGTTSIITTSTPIAGPGGKRKRGPNVVCNTCAADCTTCYYHNLRATSMNICRNCYYEGRFPSHLVGGPYGPNFGPPVHTGDFVRIEDRRVRRRWVSGDGTVDDDDQESSQHWTDEELFLLLEGVELYDDNWDRVAEHVRTRSREECLEVFLRLPIEDGYLNESIRGVGVEKEILEAVAVDGKGKYAFGLDRLPVPPLEDPAMSAIVMLANITRPRVARAAAKVGVEWQEKKERERLAGGVIGVNGTAAVSQQLQQQQPHQHHRHQHSQLSPQHQQQQQQQQHPHGHLASDPDSASVTKCIRVAELYMRKFSVKVAQVLELEARLEGEKIELETERRALAIDRILLRKEREEFEAARREEAREAEAVGREEMALVDELFPEEAKAAAAAAAAAGDVGGGGDNGVGTPLSSAGSTGGVASSSAAVALQ